MDLTQNQIKALKGKCKGCGNTGEQLGMVVKTKHGMLCAMQTCEDCLGNKKATIEIEKEWVERKVLGVETQDGQFPHRTKIKIPKYKVNGRRV